MENYVTRKLNCMYIYIYVCVCMNGSSVKKNGVYARVHNTISSLTAKMVSRRTINED